MTKSREELLFEIMQLVDLPRDEMSNLKLSKKELFHIHSWLLHHKALIEQIRTRIREIERGKHANHRTN